MSNIGFDLDDTVIDHTHHHLLLLQDYIPNITLNAIKEGSYKSLLTQEQYVAYKRKLYGPYTPSADPTRGIIEMFKTLQAEQHTLFIISRRPPEYQNYAEQWIETHLSFLAHSNVIFVSHYSEKNVHCQHHDIQYYIDNDPDALQYIQPPTTPFLFDEHNLYPNTPYTTIHKWKQLIEWL